jgi:YD repeat-containing protein
MFDLYNNIIGIDPESEISGIIDEEDADGTNEQQEYDEATLLNNTLLADSSEPVKYKDLLPNVKHI